ncbi:MAG: hypothetical protein K1000chlam4_00624 [Chlamydiae bacterium]|nr:hypothetical protein [Chlamydiota bacterium]
MASKKEIEKHLKIALKEIGEIKPRFNRSVGEWIFKHSLYPVECGGDTKEEVIKNYPLYLKEFIAERLNANLNPRTEKKTRGRGGKRAGSGRPKGTAKLRKKRVYIPEDIAPWLKDPHNIEKVRRLMR